jgi:hypothetical protein
VIRDLLNPPRARPGSVSSGRPINLRKKPSHVYKTLCDWDRGVEGSSSTEAKHMRSIYRSGPHWMISWSFLLLPHRKEPAESLNGPVACNRYGTNTTATCVSLAEKSHQLMLKLHVVCALLCTLDKSIARGTKYVGDKLPSHVSGRISRGRGHLL